MLSPPGKSPIRPLPPNRSLVHFSTGCNLKSSSLLFALTFLWATFSLLGLLFHDATNSSSYSTVEWAIINDQQLQLPSVRRYPERTGNQNSSSTKQFHEIPSEEFDGPKLKLIKPNVNLRTSYQDASVIEQSVPWFVPKRICKSSSDGLPKCCAETVAISLDQDDHHIINTVDGTDLADVLMRKSKVDGGLDFFGTELDDNIVECLQPGTIIHVANHRDLLQAFFTHFRPKMGSDISYVVITSRSDADSPLGCCGRYLSDDPNMIAWLGQSPNIGVIPKHKRDNGIKRLIGFPLGLSNQHNQDRYLSRFLQLTNYTNPFKNKDKYNQSLLMTTMRTVSPSNSADASAIIDDLFYQNAFIRFGITHRKIGRLAYFQNLCDGYNNTHPSSKLDNLSCRIPGINTGKVSVETYRASSKYLFGFSPAGVGFDCYRTYEYLLLGIIPVLPKRPHGVQGMFDDLPVLQLDDFEKNRTRAEYLQIFYNYIASPEFQNNDFDKGWSQLFLRYWRRKVLDLTGRTKDIVVDPETGREYYQAWRYSVPDRKQ
mmetsp:Transcript_41819/g.100368  ORF Transcript_41819/g.100368 Transcript_41819/m.100368 type:complete len:542 (-) Transcript_41819:1019-2644(-)|eukprot:CAMPEP_0113464158 /NCGR_PEP_ID=MMETSP0014_2-20120614/13050_1 /TAXON_ID=2857 /ORGANISM="Nitzschia sp." /LENGTH=541 /DNA_ID=CAMNT_0000356217 /DNA_START=167 /DNA_END=1792 /DNA_ORIENTATION=+ /assembly_acc=CAM_ASM_000159